MPIPEERGRLIGEALQSDDWTEGEKKIIEWQWRMTGGFYTALIELMCRADVGNLARLGKGFPSLADAVRQWKYGDLGERMRVAGVL